MPDDVAVHSRSEAKIASPDTAAQDFRLADFLPYRIVALGHAMGETLAASYGDQGVTINEWRTLAVIGAAGAGASVAARDVVASTPLDKMAVSRAVASLEAKGLVARCATSADRRVSRLALTDAGEAVRVRIVAIALEYESRLLHALELADRQRLSATLAVIESRAASLAADAPFSGDAS